MHPVLFQIGPLTVYSLSVFWALGALAAVWILQLELRCYRHDKDLVATLVMSAAIGGLIGARLLFIAEEWEQFTRVPFALLIPAGFLRASFAGERQKPVVTPEELGWKE